MPEVGGELCDYVDPTSVDSIADAVARFALDGDYRDGRAAAVRRAKLRTWTDFAGDVLDVALHRAQAGADNFQEHNHHRQGASTNLATVIGAL